MVLKALEKDRTRRYETANGLARDIQRYLADEVVEARPPVGRLPAAEVRPQVPDGSDGGVIFRGTAGGGRAGRHRRVAIRAQRPVGCPATSVRRPNESRPGGGLRLLQQQPD